MENTIPFVDLKAQYSNIGSEVKDAVNRVLDKGQFILGDEVKAFETEFATYCETPYCVALANGTAALHLALLVSGIGPGDEVLTTPLTFIATAEAISQVGATPVFVDVNPLTGSLDPNKLEARITQRTKAIIPVHLYGNPTDMSPILEIAKTYNLKVIEDAAQAHGARYMEKRVGTLGTIGSFSFYPSKNLGAYGDAGALVTNNPDSAEQIRSLRDHGRLDKYNHNQPGYNYRMDSLQGAVLRVKLRYLEVWTQKRRQVADWYADRLTHLELARVRSTPNAYSVYHLFVIRVGNRDRVSKAMSEQGIQVGIHYPIPIHLLEAYRHLGYAAGDFPAAESLCRDVLSLPMYPELTLPQVEKVVDALSRCI